MSGTESLLDLIKAFDAASIPYMIVGSYSSNYYGIPRLTKNADLVVHLPSEKWGSLNDILPQGLDWEDQSSFELVTTTRRELLRVRGSLFQIELFRLSEDPHDQSRFARRRKVEIFPGREIFLPTPEDVIVQKLRWNLRAMRPKDFEDAVAVIQVQENSLDWDYMAGWTAMHGTSHLLEMAKARAAG